MLAFQYLASSCLRRLALSSVGVLDETASVKYISNGKKQIVFFPMHHIGKKIFYDDAKNKIDSLISQGYFVYFESVRMPVTDSLQKDTIYRKARKITGVDFLSISANKGYIDTANNEIMGLKLSLIEKYHLVNQPKNIYPVNDSAKVKNVDASFPQLITACEQKFGPIVLDQYDFETKLGEKYKYKNNKELKKYFVEGFRNVLISNAILNDTHEKIIAVYGSRHFDGILEELITADKNYKQVEKL